MERNVPKLRFKGFNDEWQEKKLIDLADKKDKYSFTGGPFGSDLKSEHYTEEGVQIIQLQNIGDGYFVDENKIYTSEEKADELNSCNIYPGEIIIAKMADPVARACVIPYNNKRYLMASDGIRLAVNKNKYSTIFTLNYINSNYFRKKAILNSTGATRLRIGLSELKNISLKVPSIQEQERIANFLTKVDKIIEKQDEKVKNLEKYKKGMMQKIFSQEIRFKDENGEEYPEWEDKKIGDIFIEVNEKTSIKNQYEILSSTSTGLFKQSEYFNREIASEDNTGYKILRKKQIVLSPQNLWIGNINYNNKYETGIVSPSYKIFNVAENTLPQFVAYIIKLNRMLYEYKQASEQGASIVRRNLNMDLFNDIVIKLPCYREQSRVTAYLNNIDVILEKEKNKLEKLKQWKKGLLQQIFV